MRIKLRQKHSDIFHKNISLSSQLLGKNKDIFVTKSYRDSLSCGNHLCICLYTVSLKALRIEKSIRILYVWSIVIFVDCSFVLLLSSRGLDGLKEKYSRNIEELEVDRIIFTASANNSPLPTRLMEGVKNTARKENKGKSCISQINLLVFLFSYHLKN